MYRRAFIANALLAPSLSAATDLLSGRARLRPAICAYSFRNELKAKTMTYEDLVRRAVEWNVDGLDLTVYWFPSAGPEFLLPLRRLAYKMGVEIYSISVRTELTKASSADRTSEIQALCNWVDVANELGAGHIRVFGGEVPAGSSEAQAVGWVAEALTRASDYSARKGIILGLENHGGITMRAERVVEIVRRVDSPWVGINLDTGNFARDGYRQIEMCLPYAVNVQIKAEMMDDDGKSVPQDWDRVIGMIGKSGYKGYLALEYEASAPALDAVPPMLVKLRQLSARYSESSG
jgi:L-ribulose-5-phosphate 3-epimerase